MLCYLSIQEKIQKFYYLIKPLLPRKLQILLRRYVVKRLRERHVNVWPVNNSFCVAPSGWRGWPDKKQFALILTHDVEGIRGYKKIEKLVAIEKEFGFRSSFNFVPKRYTVTPELQTYLTDNGFEIGIHGLYHDGKLYNSEKIFRERAAKINKYLKDWDAVGFRAPSMHHNLEWNCYLNIEYDLSTFDTDPFEPQSDGLGTIFPQIYKDCKIKQLCQLDCKGYVEIPYTLPQDFTVFILLQEKNIDIWKQKVGWLAEKGGMVLVNTHPDYMNFGDEPMKVDEYPSDYYAQFLAYIKSTHENRYWHVLPKEISRYWKTNYSA